MGEAVLTERAIEYRELRNEESLRAYFSLRYRECLSAGYHITQNQAQLNVEPYDFFGHFIGAFTETADGALTMVGGVRMVNYRERGPAFHAIREICNATAELKGLEKVPRLHPFQLMEALDLSPFLVRWRKEGKKVVEFSRTVVDPAFRQHGIGGDLVKAIIHHGASVGADVGLGGCPARLERFYESSGCRVAARFYHELHHCDAALLVVDLEQIRRKIPVLSA